MEKQSILAYLPEFYFLKDFHGFDIDKLRIEYKGSNIFDYIKATNSNLISNIRCNDKLEKLISTNIDDYSLSSVRFHLSAPAEGNSHLFLNLLKNSDESAEVVFSKTDFEMLLLGFGIKKWLTTMGKPLYLLVDFSGEIRPIMISYNEQLRILDFDLVRYQKRYHCSYYMRSIFLINNSFK